MEINKTCLDSEDLPQLEENNFVIQEFDEYKQKKQQKEIEDIKLKDSKEKDEKIKYLMNCLNEETEIEQRIIDLFNQLKKEKNREEYLRKYIKDWLDKNSSTYDSKKIKNLIAKYTRSYINGALDFHNSITFFNTVIQNLKGDIRKNIKMHIYEKTPYKLWHDIGKFVLESAFWEDFELIWMSGYTGVYSTSWWDKVYKLNTLALLKSFEKWNDYCDSSKSNEDENELFRKMQEYFPEGRVLIPQNHKKTINLDKNLIGQLWIFNTNFPKSFSFIYTTTPLAKEIDEGCVWFNLGFWWWTMSKLMWEDFAKRFESKGVTQEELNTYFDKLFEEVIQNIKKLSNDEWKIKEFLRWLIKFSDENDVVFDIYWKNNFTFYLDSSWNLAYHIIDPFMPWNFSKSKLESLKKEKGKGNVTKDNIHVCSNEYIMQKFKNYCE